MGSWCPRHLDDPKGRRDLSGSAMFDRDAAVGKERKV
jgi:hypothetical protein